MGIAIKELLRRPGRFVPVSGALTLLVLLLAVLGGFLDGLELSQTGPYRAHEGRLLAFSNDSELLIQRSRLDADQRKRLAESDGVADVGVLDQIESTAGNDGGDLDDIVLFGYDSATDVIPSPTSDGGAVVDEALATSLDIDVGDSLLLGASSESVPVDAVVSDLSQGSPTVWLASARWREIVGAGNPAALPPEGVDQALVITPADDADVDELVERLGTVDGVTVATTDEVIDALPAVQQQSTTFRGIIGVTFVVTLLVVALFFALITLERVGLYAVLKALGARTIDLLAGISVQALAVSAVALVLGFAASFLFAGLLPADLPVRLVPTRLAQIAVGVLVTSLVGSLFTLRRILRIEPAEAIG